MTITKVCPVNLWWLLSLRQTRGVQQLHSTLRFWTCTSAHIRHWRHKRQHQTKKAPIPIHGSHPKVHDELIICYSTQRVFFTFSYRVEDGWWESGLFRGCCQGIFSWEEYTSSAELLGALLAGHFVLLDVLIRLPLMLTCVIFFASLALLFLAFLVDPTKWKVMKSTWQNCFGLETWRE